MTKRERAQMDKLKKAQASRIDSIFHEVALVKTQLREALLNESKKLGEKV